jgi:EpsD family peptidyl-prolyl cis-trans isomerase
MNIRSGFAFSLALACAAALVTGCSRKSSDTSAVLASVNGENVTQAQLDYALSQITAAHPGASAPASGQVLKDLVEQRLVTQKAEKDRLDRNPGVLQALEASRKDALARFYVEQFLGKVPKPTADDIKQYYDAHPANFAQRNVYMVQKIDARVAPDQVPALMASAQATTSAAQMLDLLKARALSTNVSQTPQPAESLGPLLPKFVTLKVGQSLVVAQAQGFVALTLVSVDPRPVTVEQATPGITQLLWNQRKRDALQNEARSLRAAAKIDYLGKFAASAPAVATPQPAASDAASAASQ